MKVYKLTETPPPYRKEVWGWRADEKKWFTYKFLTCDTEKFGKPEYAYTHWAEITFPEKPNNEN